MKYKELKDAYNELKINENALNMPLTKAEKNKLIAKQNELKKIMLKYENLFIINAKELKQALEGYFISKNVQVDIKFGEKVEKQTSETFEGTGTCVYHYPYISMKYNDKTYTAEINALFGRTLSYFHPLEFSVLNFQTNILKILDGFYNGEGLAELYEDFSDILEMLWDLVLENIKKLNQQKIDKINAIQQEKHNLIVELTDPQIVAKKVAKIQDDISSLEKEKENYSFDELDNIIIKY